MHSRDSIAESAVPCNAPLSHTLSRALCANAGGPRQLHLLNWAHLVPGEVHNLAIEVAPTPESILDGTFSRFQAAGKDPVLYLPRDKAYQGEPSIPSILFSTDGKPGPSIKELLHMVPVDDAGDTPFAVHGWRKTYVAIDVSLILRLY